MKSPETLLIIGASARAAAYSAIRAGLKPVCADFFIDRDLTAACPAIRIPLDRPIEETSNLIANFARGQNVSRWIYTGPFENQPDLVDAIGSAHRLWGNSGAILREVRNPFRVANCLQRAGLVTPDLDAKSTGLSRDGSWLAKPLASGGGLGISPLITTSVGETEVVYFQKRIPGRSCSAIYLASRSDATLIGVTHQFHGLSGRPFAYRGNIGPMTVAPKLKSELQAMGNAIAAEFGLVGIFGIDFILNQGRAWTVEVNPRYTGSVEIFELAIGSSLLLEHRRVCDSESSKPESWSQPSLRFPKARIVGKWILYATRSLRFPEIPIRLPPDDDLYAIPEVADVPDTGHLINQGEPVMTVFGAGGDPQECLVSLRSNVNCWRRMLGFVSENDREVNSQHAQLP